MTLRRTVAVALAAAFLLFAPLGSESLRTVSAPLGVGDACADGSCKSMFSWICNIGGENEYGYCRWVDGECG